jgi:hypothetical protein
MHDAEFMTGQCGSLSAVKTRRQLLLLEGLNSFKPLFHQGLGFLHQPPGSVVKLLIKLIHAPLFAWEISVRQIFSNVCARGKIRLFELVKPIIINSADHQQLREACSDAREPASQQTRTIID